jgi:hypothetical protein
MSGQTENKHDSEGCLDRQRINTIQKDIGTDIEQTRFRRMSGQTQNKHDSEGCLDRHRTNTIQKDVWTDTE